jgi:hypothetical protein
MLDVEGLTSCLGSARFQNFNNDPRPCYNSILQHMALRAPAHRKNLPWSNMEFTL